MLRCWRKLASSAAIHHFQRRHGSGRYKVVTAKDAVQLIPNGATVTVGGFAAQNCPEELLLELGKRYRETGSPRDLTLYFLASTGDWGAKGLNHFAQKGFLKRCIGAHYGPNQMLAEMAVANEFDAYCLPMGCLCRMMRCAAAKQPGFLTKIGQGTFVDPKNGGGKANSRTKDDIVSEVFIKGKRYLYYEAIPVDVALLRGTTADPDGNITFENESLVVDNLNQAIAARSSRGLVVVQAQAIAAVGSLRPREVVIPGTMVDCVVETSNPENHHMSYVTKHNPAAVGLIRKPPSFAKMPLNERKIIARRACLEVMPGHVVNLGIGMPEAVAIVANEEKILQHVELTTEPGVHGGVGLSGHDFGAAVNYDALLPMHSQFDFYNGGGLDICFLGMAEVSPNGDVNVTKTGPKLIGPGGFIDISQSTKNVNLVGTFTTGELKVGVENGKLKIYKEGKVKKFVNKVKEVSFSGDFAIANGQKVTFITERAVLSLTEEGVLLEEIAPGIDLQKDVLDQMEFVPRIMKPLKLMNPDIFKPELMKLYSKTFGTSMRDRMFYRRENNTVFANLSYMSVQLPEQCEEIESAIAEFISKNGEGGKANVVVNYEGFNVHPDLSDDWSALASRLQKNYYLSVRRYTGRAFTYNKLGSEICVSGATAAIEMTLQDVQCYVKQLGLMLSEDTVENFFRRADTGRSGSLRGQELKALLQTLQDDAK